jgi:hypothetical protein
LEHVVIALGQAIIRPGAFDYRAPRHYEGQ